MESAKKPDKDAKNSSKLKRAANCKDKPEREVVKDYKPFKDISRPVSFERLWEHVMVR
jgi:hypothetical protein